MAPLADFAFAILDGDRRARLLLDPAMTLLWANDAAKSVLEASHIIGVQAGKICTTQTKAQSALESFIRGSTAVMSSWCLPDPNDDGHLILRCQRMVSGDHVAFALALISSGSRFETSYPGVQQAYDLTKSEYKVLCALMAGSDADSIARSQAIALGTVRSHIKSLYSKMRVSSREALFRLTVPFGE